MLRRLGRRRRCGIDRRRLLLLKLLPVDVILVEFFRHALVETGNTAWENRLAISRQFFLGVEHIEHVGGIEAARAGATGEDPRYGNQDDGSDQAM